MLPTSHSGPWSNNAYLPAGWTGTELTEYAVNYDGAGSGAAKFDSTNDALEIEFAGTPETISYWFQQNAASGYVFKVEESADGATWTAVATYDGVGIPSVAQPRTNAISAASRRVRFRYETRTIGNIGLDGVAIAGWPTNFCVSLDRRDGFGVETGTVAVIVATARNGAEPYHYAWGSTLGAEHWTADGAAFTILGSAPVGAQAAWVVATDSGEPVQSASNSVGFVVAMKYDVAIAPSSHGTATTEPAARAAAGETVLVLAAPDEGYRLAALALEAAGSDACRLAESAFVMPAANVAVRATFEEIPPEGSYGVDFEDATKSTYETANVSLGGKSWELAQALIGTDAGNVLAGFKSVRLRDGTNAPSLTLLEDLTNGVGRLSFKYRTYLPTVSTVDWEAQYSRDGGAHWVRIGRPFAPSALDVVQIFSRGVHVTGPVRLRIVRGSTNVVEGNRLIIDDVVATPYGGLGEPIIEDVGSGPEPGAYEIEAPGGYAVAEVLGANPAVGGTGAWSNLTEGVHYGLSNATVTIRAVPNARQWIRLGLSPLP